MTWNNITKVYIIQYVHNLNSYHHLAIYFRLNWIYINSVKFAPVGIDWKWILLIVVNLHASFIFMISKTIKGINILFILFLVWDCINTTYMMHTKLVKPIKS